MKPTLTMSGPVARSMLGPATPEAGAPHQKRLKVAASCPLVVATGPQVAATAPRFPDNDPESEEEQGERRGLAAPPGPAEKPNHDRTRVPKWGDEEEADAEIQIRRPKHVGFEYPRQQKEENRRSGSVYEPQRGSGSSGSGYKPRRGMVAESRPHVNQR